MNKNKILIPVAIILAAIVFGIIWYITSTKSINVDNKNNEISEELKSNNIYNIVSIKKAAPGVPAKVNQKYDYIFGNSDADLFVVEYSDLECPYCKLYHNDIAKFADKYLKTGKIAFVFRHFPIAKPISTTNLHPSSVKESKAAECVGAIAGDKKFYKFISLIFNLSKSDGKFNTSALPEIIEKFGVDKKKWSKCYNDEKIFNKIKASFDEGVNAGVQGTPTVFILGKDGMSKKIPANSLNEEVISTILDEFLKQNFGINNK